MLVFVPGAITALQGMVRVMEAQKGKQLVTHLLQHQTIVCVSQLYETMWYQFIEVVPWLDPFLGVVSWLIACNLTPLRCHCQQAFRCNGIRAGHTT